MVKLGNCEYQKGNLALREQGEASGLASMATIPISDWRTWLCGMMVDGRSSLPVLYSNQQLMIVFDAI